MNGTRINIGSTMCGIILENGRDCNAVVQADSPLNLCPPHFTEAAAWVWRNDETKRERTVCQFCGKAEARAGTSGYSCGFCEYQTPDFVGTTRLSPAEAAQTFERPPAPKAVEVVYYIQFGDRIKIGTSANVRNRLNALPHDRVLAFERGGVTLESRRHTKFREHRIGNTEWFHVNKELVAHVAELTAGQPEPWELYRQWRKR